MGVVDNYENTETMICFEIEDIERAKVEREGEGGEKRLFGMVDYNRDVKDVDNLLLDFKKNKILLFISDK